MNVWEVFLGWLAFLAVMAPIPFVAGGLVMLFHPDQPDNPDACVEHDVDVSDL